MTVRDVAARVTIAISRDGMYYEAFGLLSPHWPECLHGASNPE